MDLKTGFASTHQTDSLAPTTAAQAGDERRIDSDRRVYDERRRAGGLFEVRARRDSSGYDRRRGERRLQSRSWFNFWRRDG